MRLKTLLFDFDGTLAPNLDLPGMRREVVAFTAAAGVPASAYHGRYIVEVIDAASAWLAEQDAQQAAQYAKDAHDIILRIELDAAAETDPFPGIDVYLQDLANDGIRCGVVTRNCRQAVLATFPDLLDYVETLHARDDVTHLKPDPRHLQAALDALDANPASSAMVGDGGLDMQVGKSLGLHCVGVLSGSADTETLRQHGADLVLDHCLNFDPRRQIT